MYNIKDLVKDKTVTFEKINSMSTLDLRNKFIEHGYMQAPVTPIPSFGTVTGV